MGLANRSWLTLLASGWLASAALQAADAPTTVRLTGGTRFPLELAHHLTSGYTPAGSPVYFRVLSDVRVGDQVLIRGGTVVEGRMQATGDRKMNATSGTMNFSVRHVPAVDGQNVRVIATVSQEGRDRDGALLGWVFMWGALGMGVVAGRPNLTPSDQATFEGMKAKLKEVAPLSDDGDDKK
jgi:hypothetical protein